MSGLAKQIALPHELTPTRFPSFPALERTAVLGFNAPVSWSIPSGSVMRAIVCRQAAYPFWLDVACVGTEAHYLSFLAVINNSLPSPLTIDSGIFAQGTGTRTPASSYVPAITANPWPNGLHAVIGVDAATGTVPYIWHSGGTMMVVGSLTAAAAGAAQIDATLEKWMFPGEVSTNIIYSYGFVVGVGNFGAAGTQALPPGWYRLATVTCSIASVPSVVVTLISTVGTPAYAPSGVNAGTVTVGSTGSNFYMWPAITPSEFNNSPLPWSATRTTAAAGLFTNVTQVLNKGGTVLGGRLNPMVTNVWTFSSASLNNLHPAEKAYLALETGAYTYCPPSTDISDFYDYTMPLSTSSAATTTLAPVFRLDNSSLVSALVFTPAAGVAEALALNLDWHIEFRTSSALFEIGMSTATIESLHQAQLALASVGYFFPNNNHKSVLAKVAKGTASFLRAALPYATAIPGPVGMAAKAGTMLMSTRPPPSIPTTSGERSGISSRPRAQHMKQVKVKTHKVKVGKKK